VSSRKVCLLHLRCTDKYIAVLLSLHGHYCCVNDDIVGLISFKWFAVGSSFDKSS